jgi:hypothetical protein
MTSLHPMLLKLLRSAKDQVEIARRTVGITKTGEEELLRATEHCIKVEKLFTGIQKVVDEDDRIKIGTLGSGNSFQKVLETIMGEGQKELKEASRLLDPTKHQYHSDYYTGLEKINVPLLQPSKTIFYSFLCLDSIWLLGLVTTVFLYMLGFSIPFKIIVGLSYSGMIGLGITIISFLFCLGTNENVDYGYALAKKNYQIKFLQEKISKIKILLIDLANKTFTKSWYVNNIPHDVLNLLHYNLRICKDTKNTEVSASKINDATDLAADALVSRLYNLLQSTDSPYDAWTLTTHRRLDESKLYNGVLVENVPELDDLIKSLINSFVYVKLEIEGKFTLIFLVSEQEVKSEDWDGIKPIAGYSAEEIISYLRAAEES